MRRVDILEFIDHDIFQSLLPFEFDFFVLPEDIKREENQIIIIKPEAFLFLIQISVEQNIIYLCGFKILLMKIFQRHLDHMKVIIRFIDAFAHFKIIPCIGKGHVSECQSSFFINDIEHCINIGVIKNHEAFRIGNCMGILLQHRNTEAVESIDIAGIIVTGQLMNSLSHLIGSFVCECNA